MTNPPDEDKTPTFSTTSVFVSETVHSACVCRITDSDVPLPVILAGFESEQARQDVVSVPLADISLQDVSSMEIVLPLMANPNVFQSTVPAPVPLFVSFNESLTSLSLEQAL